MVRSDGIAVLVLEDDLDLADILQTRLEHWGYSVTRALSFQEATGLLEKPSFSGVKVILADIALPDGNGLDFLHECRARDPNVQFIVMSAQNRWENVGRAIALESVVFLSKPFSSEVLRYSLELLLSRNREKGEMRILNLEQNCGEISVATHWEYILRLENFLRELLRPSMSEQSLADLMLAFKEITANAIEWGNGENVEEDIQVSYRFSGSNVIITVSDCGDGFNWEKVMEDQESYYCGERDPLSVIAQRERTGKRPGGWGLLLAKKYVDSLHFDRNGASVSIIKNVSDTNY